MSDEPFIMPEATHTPTVRRPFPAVAQFFVLVLLLGGLLGGVVFPYLIPRATTDSTTTPGTVGTNPATIALVDELLPPPVGAKAVYVYDVVANRALYNKNADEVLPLASIAKLMTALVAREIVNDDDAFTVPKAATTQTSASGLAWGEVLTVRELRDYAMLASSNDAAYTIANETGQLLDDTTPNQAFVEAMNITAEELNLTSLRFKNPTGLDLSPTEAGAYGSARDVSFLMSYILRHYSDILAPTTMAYERIHNTEGAYHEAENTNPAINSIPNLLGSKTGYTDLAGGNLTIVFDAGYNRPIIITVLGSTYDGRFADVVALTKSVQEAFRTAHQSPS
jgi:D-alanyl-D-alanine carboxypeptidase (penicillin-binding protein 5/6)